ncbi:MAG: ABC transporter permease subunit [Erysipelotrichaceae bacterium]|nr:ABC transporter permease subunit [Erysipelotrichaceae bacterium]MBQ1533472.1 ABC transporter permease subunit [Erysipelotrichaceae bacterium]
MKKSTADQYRTYLYGIVLLLLVWQLFAVMINEETMVFPGPLQTFRYAFALLGKSYTYRCLGATFSKMLCGYLISLAAALILGTVSGNSVFFERLLSPFITTLRAVPTASLIYFFIVLTGFKKAPMMMVILICFPILYEGIAGGIRNVPLSVLNACRLDGAGFIKRNLRIRLPLALPYIVVAMTSSFSLCFKIEIMAEVITGSANAGLGSVIAASRSADPTNMIPIFAYSLIAVAIMLMIDFIGSTIRNKTNVN